MLLEALEKGTKKGVKRKVKRKNEPRVLTAIARGILRTMLLLIWIFPLTVYGETPRDTVQKQVNSVLDILRAPPLRGDPSKEAKRKKIRAITDEWFAFDELSKRTLGPNWEKLNPVQQKEFIQLYREIIEGAYLDKILTYSNEKVLFTGERMLDRGQAEVSTKIMTKTVEIPIEYRLLEKAGDWKVYDVIIEGVSLVKNYRAQFREILAKKSIEDMLDLLRKKVRKE
jgi:phospholipid transport system substrate-binding protein